MTLTSMPRLVLVCLKLINDDSDRTSMMGMQMLSAILDGESEDVRDSTVRQLAVPEEEVGIDKLLTIYFRESDS